MTNRYLAVLKSKKNIQIVGAAGTEGSTVALFLADQGIKNVILHDFSAKEDFKHNFINSRDYWQKKEAEETYQKLIKTGYKINYKEDYLEGIEKADLIFVSQGWFRYPANQKLKELKGKVPFSSVTELYFQFSPCPIIGITGTVGKSTTANLIYQMLKDCGQKAYLSGNDRNSRPILHKLLKLPKNAYLVLEVSNRQLIDLDYSPHIAVVTNIFPNHLDDHGSLANYIAAKRNIVAHQKTSDYAILNYDNDETQRFSQNTPAKIYFYSLKSKKGSLKKAVFVGADKFPAGNNFKLKGEHNLANILAAFSVALILKLNLEQASRSLAKFEGLKHRLERVAEKNGVVYVEDSQSTNPNSTIAAIGAFENKSIILIAGGFRPKFKIAEFKGMMAKFAEEKVKQVFLIGKIAPVLFQEFKRQKKAPLDKIKICADLAEAVRLSSEIAKKGDVVLLSPGVESFGEFKDYRERGEKFKELINEFI